MKAPSFRLQAQDGRWVTSEEILARGPVVMVFFPGAFTPVCTRQLCSYQENFIEFENLGIQLYGISGDDPEKNLKFKEKYKFGFSLLSDPGKIVTQAFGATSKWMLGGATRANFILDQAGDIVHKHLDGLPVTHQKSDVLLETINRLKKVGRI
jgi:thioredoxin-dependent peroxiredoxin